MSSDNPPQDRATAYASMEEWEKRCNDYSGETVHDLANEVLLLRTAGDALADEVIDGDNLNDLIAAVTAWREARHG